MAEYITHSKEETIELARRLSGKLKAGDIIFYRGGLGMGKTAFTQGICDGLGIDATVTSPTFAIVNEFHGRPLNLYHFDMYRIENEDQLFNIGFYDYLDSDGVLAIEWSENIEDFFDEATITVSFEKLSDSERKITINGVDLD